MRSEFFTHADAGIRNTVSEYDIVRGSSGFTEGFKSNASTIMGEFYGIAYDIDQDLTKEIFPLSIRLMSSTSLIRDSR